MRLTPFAKLAIIVVIVGGAAAYYKMVYEPAHLDQQSAQEASQPAVDAAPAAQPQVQETPTAAPVPVQPVPEPAPAVQPQQDASSNRGMQFLLKQGDSK